MNNSWELIDLRVFNAVVRRGSFVGAADELGISPAYVSKRIADFEASLGVTLFHRTTRRVQITAEGEVAHAWAQKVLESAEGLSREVAGTQQSPGGPLRISTSLRMGRHHVSPVLSRLKQAYPNLNIWLELVDRRVDLLAEGIDIDIRAGDVQEPHLVAYPLARNARILCASPAYIRQRGEPKTLPELSRHDCLLFRERDQTFGVWRLQGANGAESVRVTGPMGSNHSDIVRNWALDGHGIILLSSWDVADELRDGSLVRVLPDYRQPADIYAVTPARLGSSARLRVCVDFLIRHLTEGPYALDTRFA